MADNGSQIYQNSETPNSIYRYQAFGQFIANGDKYDIKPINVKSLVIDYDYDDNNFPLMYATLVLSSKTVDAIVQNQDTGVFILNVQKCIYNGDMPDLWRNYISDKFVYFISEDINKTSLRDYENTNQDREDIWRECVVGLVSQTLLNSNKKVINGIITGDMTSAICYAVNNRPIILEPLEYNSSLKNVFLPPMNSVAKSIAYLNRLRVFYRTSYRYFMDYDITYLLSSKGNAVPRKGDKATSVLINLRNDYDSGSKVQGITMDEKRGYYAIDVSGTDCQLANDNSTNKSFTNISFTTTDGKKTNKTTSTLPSGTNLVNKTRNVRIPNNNVGMMENITNSVKSNTIKLLMWKNDLDTSVLTMNKQYTINADAVYKDKGYSGTYLLSRKRELYIKADNGNQDDRFTMSTMLLLSKVER